jgi:hypothetical protein
MKIFIIVSSIVLSVIGALIILIIFINKKIGEITDPGLISNKVPVEYKKLLKLTDSCCDSTINGFSFVETIDFTYRNPVSSFFIQNQYYLEIYKIDSSFSSTLNRAIRDSYTNAETWISTPYAADDKTDLEFFYKSSKPKKANDIYFDLFGDNTQVMKKNDTVAYYYSRCSNFSIKFNQHDENDIYGEVKNHGEMPLEILFFKRKKNLYLAMLSSTNAGTNLKPNILYDIFFK